MGASAVKHLTHIKYIYIYNNCSISNDPKCSIGTAYIQTIKNEKITLHEYTTQSYMFYTFAGFTFLFYLKKTKAKLLLNIKYENIEN